MANQQQNSDAEDPVKLKEDDKPVRKKESARSDVLTVVNL